MFFIFKVPIIEVVFTQLALKYNSAKVN